MLCLNGFCWAAILFNKTPSKLAQNLRSAMFEPCFHSGPHSTHLLDSLIGYVAVSSPQLLQVKVQEGS